MEALLSIAIALVAGLLMSRLAKIVKLPAVTGYLVAGILIGPYALGRLGIPGVGFVTTGAVKDLDILCEVALGFIAFSIGNEFRLPQLRKIGRQVVVVAFFEALMAVVLVEAVLIGLHFLLGEDRLPLTASVVLGAIAAATAPAATLMVVRQYKAKGRLTSILLGVVALDDAIALCAFAVLYGVAQAIMSGRFDMVGMLAEPLLQVALSLVLGVIMGVLLTALEKVFKSGSKRLSLSVAFVILTVALSKLTFTVGGVHFGFSSLLVCMMLGTVFCNICDFATEMMEKADKWTAPIFILFFVLSGAELELNVFSDIAIVGVGVAYIAARSVGKYLGAYCGAALTRCSPPIRKNLGVTLLPQAGVALGMSLTAAQQLGGIGGLIRNVVLFSVLIYELVGPTLTKWALTNAGDIRPRVSVIVHGNDTPAEDPDTPPEDDD